jgi:ADP-ribosylglycohydrolase
MLKDEYWLKFSDGLETELIQAHEEGRDIGPFREKINKLLADKSHSVQKEQEAGRILDEIGKLDISDDYSYAEPSYLPGILAARPKAGTGLSGKDLSDDEHYDRLYGAWLGRCAGCLLGKPLEGWSREKIISFLEKSGNLPIRKYITKDVEPSLKKEFSLDTKLGWVDKIECMIEDDDTNYTIIGLKILEDYGPGFTPLDVADSWLRNLSFLHLCTAERIAYRNLANLHYPPESASYRNPYREWIGAQIRADFFGYINPGNPDLAADMAWKDASISHTKNGIYGEMFAAAMIAAAAVTDDIKLIILTGLSMIPENSRLAERIRLVLEWNRRGIGYDEAVAEIHELYNESNKHDWCHTIPNAMIVCAALLHGGTDLEKTITSAVLAGFDTDCNGATAGSIVGLAIGAGALPDNWIKPLNDSIISGVYGFGQGKISELAERTVSVLISINK